MTDKVLFHSLQIALLLFVIFAMIWNSVLAWQSGQGEAQAVILRGDTSMALFYGTYAAISGLLIAICLSVEVAKEHRVFWTILNTIEVAYLCLINTWFRNVILHWVLQLAMIENR